MAEPPFKSDECTCPWIYRKDMGRLYGISMGPGWLRQSDADDCPEHARGRSHVGLEARSAASHQGEADGGA